MYSQKYSWAQRESGGWTGSPNNRDVRRWLITNLTRTLSNESKLHALIMKKSKTINKGWPIAAINLLKK